MSNYGKLTILAVENAETCSACHERMLRLVKICDCSELHVCSGCIQSHSTESGFCCDKMFCRRCDGNVQVACQGCKAPRCKLCIYPARKACDRLLCSKCHVLSVSLFVGLIPRNMSDRDWVRSGLQRCSILQAIAMLVISLLGVAVIAAFFLCFLEKEKS